MRLVILAVAIAVAGCAREKPVARLPSAPPDSIVTAAVHLALSDFFSAPGNSGHAVEKTVLSPSPPLRVGDRDIRIMSREEIPTGRTQHLVEVKGVTLSGDHPMRTGFYIVVYLAARPVEGGSAKHFHARFTEYHLYHADGKFTLSEKKELVE